MPAHEHQRDNNVYILGAGFPTGAGLPLLPTFLQSARELYDRPSGLTPALYEHFDAVFNFRRDARRARDLVNLDLENIETLFSLIEMFSLVARRGRSPILQSIRHLIAHTVSVPRLLARKVRFQLPRPEIPRIRGGEILAAYETDGSRHEQRTAEFDMDEYDFAVALMAGLFELEREFSHDSIITFNYDLVVEDAADHLSCRPDYGISRVQWAVAPDLRRRAVHLLKLHGSANWAKLKQQGVRAKVHPTYDAFGPGQEPIVVPPTWKKGEVAPILEEVWTQAYSTLKNATRICIIGYSLPVTDVYFQYLLTSALADNPGLYRVMVIDNDNTGTLESRYRELFKPIVEYGRFEYYPSRDQDITLGGFRTFLIGSLFRRLGRGFRLSGLASY